MTSRRIEAAIALFGAGRELIRIRDDRASSARGRPRTRYRRARRQPAGAVARPLRRTAEDAAAKCLAELREDAVGAEQAQSAARKIVAFAAIRDELERGGPLLTGERHKGAHSDAA